LSLETNANTFCGKSTPTVVFLAVLKLIEPTGFISPRSIVTDTCLFCQPTVVGLVQKFPFVYIPSVSDVLSVAGADRA
jgi:hypothetical protein